MDSMTHLGWNSPAVVLVCDFLVKFVKWMYHEYTYPRSERDGTYIIDPEDFVY